MEDDGSLRSPVAKFLGTLRADFGAEPGDLILMVADAEPVAQAVLGTLRNRFAERHGLIPAGTRAPVWVVDFPLVEWNEGESRWDPTHHRSPRRGRRTSRSSSPTPARRSRSRTTWC